MPTAAYLTTFALMRPTSDRCSSSPADSPLWTGDSSAGFPGGSARKKNEKRFGAGRKSALAPPCGSSGEPDPFRAKDIAPVGVLQTGSHQDVAPIPLGELDVLAESRDI